MLLRKVLSGLVTIAMVCSQFHCNVLANSNDEFLLSNAYLSMQNAQFNSTSYSWEKPFFATRPDFTDGALSGKIMDFDNDGVLELLVLKLVNSYDGDEYSAKYAKAYMEMYEIVNSSLQLSTRTESYTVIDSTTDAGGLECFIKGKYIVLECATQNNTFADGASQYINIYSYNGNQFIDEIGFTIGGSSMSFEDNDQIPKKLRSLGFTETAKYFEKEWFSPYFILCDFDSSELNFINCANLAKMENNIDPIFELLITNNTIKLINEFSYISDWDSFFVDNGIMNIKTNNFSVIEKPISVILNGNLLSFDVSPYIEKGTTRVPMRKTFESLGATVDYDKETKTITARKGGTIIELVTGASIAKINGREITLTASVENKNGSTMVPLRFVSEALGAEVMWDGENKVITINLKDNS